MAATPASAVTKSGAPRAGTKGPAVLPAAIDPLDPEAVDLQGVELDDVLSPDDTAVPVEVHPDVLLVERAKAGDTAAFEQLVKQYDRQIFRTAQHIKS